jgi:hypothetical protein
MSEREPLTLHELIEELTEIRMDRGGDEHPQVVVEGLTTPIQRVVVEGDRILLVI